MSDDVVKKRWVIVKTRGQIPIKKRPIEESEKGLLELLRELADLHDKATVELIVVRLTWNYDIWVDCGWEYLTLDSFARQA